jgi:hypothetical protein
MIQIKNYWQLPAKKQQKQLDKINKIETQKALEQEAEEKRMLIYKGQLIKPEDYPCICKFEAPEHCYEDLKTQRKWLSQEKRAKQCFCPCHTWYEPF